MADVKTRVSVTSVTHEGGPVAGSLGDTMTVTPLSFDASIAKTGKCLSFTGTASASPAPLALPGIASIYLLHAVNKSSTGVLTISVNDDSGSWSVPVPPNGVAIMASKTGGRLIAGVGSPLSVSGAGVNYEVVVAGAS